MMRWLAFLLLGLSPAAAFVPPPVQVMDVPDNATLTATATTAFPQGVYRSDFAAGNGAPPLFYRPSGSACSAADNGAQVSSADGKCWLAVFPANGADVRQWGVKADGVTDNSTPLQQAVNWAMAGNGRLLLPRGVMNYTTEITNNVPAGATFSMIGAGVDASILRPAGAAMQFTKANGDQTATIHFRDFSLLAAGASTSAGIVLIATGNITNPGISAASDISNVIFRGDDNYGFTKCWQNAIYTNYWSNIIFTNDVFNGCTGTPPSGIGVSLAGGTGESQIGVLYNFTNCAFNLLGAGILYGAYVQGVTVNQGNFTSNNYGIHVPAPSGGQHASQLGVSNSQFGFNTRGVWDELGVAPANYSNNLFFTNSNNTDGIRTVSDLTTVVGNTFLGSSAATTGRIGVNVTTGNHAATITGNAFDTLDIGINNASSDVVASGNSFSGVGSNVVSGNAVAFLLNGPQILASVTVTGAVNDGSGHVKLTVPTSAGFTNGQIAFVGGVGGIPSVQSGLFSSLTIVDGTHITANNASFSGAYTSGGVISATQ